MAVERRGLEPGGSTEAGVLVAISWKCCFNLKPEKAFYVISTFSRWLIWVPSYWVH